MPLGAEVPHSGTVWSCSHSHLHKQIVTQAFFSKWQSGDWAVQALLRVGMKGDPDQPSVAKAGGLLSWKMSGVHFPLPTLCIPMLEDVDIHS